MDAETRAWLQERIDGRLAAGTGIAWLVLVQVAMALEPTTHQPEWWFGQMACVLVLLGGSVAALQWSANGLPIARHGVRPRADEPHVTAGDEASRG
jgi:protein-S-isoprenylcysteine O-methyltransferase Ste14